MLVSISILMDAPILMIILKEYTPPASTASDARQSTVPSLSFNISQRSIKLHGPIDLIMAYTVLLKRDLSLIGSSAPIGNFSALSTDQRLENESRDFPGTWAQADPARSAANAKVPFNTFAMRKTQDPDELKLWMNQILPSLFDILDDAIGGDYSVSFVREGATEQTSTAVIRIESLAMPAQITKKDIRQTLDRKCGISLEARGIRLRFLRDALRLLSGKDPTDPKDEEDSNTDLDQQDLPWHARYWESPGMGASVGLFCTDEEFATLGSYIEVDDETYILTVDHFISESYLKVVDGVKDRLTLTSPALAKVKSMKRNLEAMHGSLEGKLKAEAVSAFPQGEVTKEGLENLPSNIRSNILKTSSYCTGLKIWLNELKKDRIDFRIGSLIHRCDSNDTAALCESSSSIGFDHSTHLEAIHRHRLDWTLSAPLCESSSSAVFDHSTHPEEMYRHKLDWALFKVDSRMGTNHHRYRYNDEKGGLEYELDVERISPGPTVDETGVVDANAKVYFEGQTSGRVYGEINAALRLVRLDGRKTLEHHIIIDASRMNRATEYYGRGDSGAAVLRASDNKLLGIVWACHANQPVFTPIRTIFQDIKKNLNAVEVRLPAVQREEPPEALTAPITNEATYSSGNEEERPGKRPFRLPEVDEFAQAKESERIIQSLGDFTSPFTIDEFLKAINLDSTIVTRASTPTPSLSESRSSSPELESTPRSQSPFASANVKLIADPPIIVDHDSNSSLEMLASQRFGKTNEILGMYQSARPDPSWT